MPAYQSGHVHWQGRWCPWPSKFDLVGTRADIKTCSAPRIQMAQEKPLWMCTHPWSTGPSQEADQLPGCSHHLGCRGRSAPGPLSVELLVPEGCHTHLCLSPSKGRENKILPNRAMKNRTRSLKKYVFPFHNSHIFLCFHQGRAACERTSEWIPPTHGPAWFLLTNPLACHCRGKTVPSNWRWKT